MRLERVDAGTLKGETATWPFVRGASQCALAGKGEDEGDVARTRSTYPVEPGARLNDSKLTPRRVAKLSFEGSYSAGPSRPGAVAGSVET